METNDSPPSEDDNDEMDNNIVEQDVSIVGQEASDEESEDEESEDRRYLELSEPVRHIPTPTKTSPYKDMDLTRGKLVSSVSPKHDPKTKAKKQSLPSQVPTFRSMRGGPSSSVSLKHEGSVGSTNTFSSPFVKHPQTPAASTSRLFAPVTTEMTPVTQLFSPVPYLSDLIQAKKDKLHSSFQQLKQRDMYSIKAPQKTISPMVNQSSFSASMVPNVDVPTGTSYNFSPPTQVPVDAHTTSVTTPERSESMSYVFSPPLTRSAARQRREGSCSVSRESSVEPTLPVGSEAVRRKPRGRCVWVGGWVGGGGDARRKPRGRYMCGWWGWGWGSVVRLGSVGPIERGLSDDVLKSEVYFGPVVYQIPCPWSFSEMRPVTNLRYERTICAGSF